MLVKSLFFNPFDHVSIELQSKQNSLHWPFDVGLECWGVKKSQEPEDAGSRNEHAPMY